MDVYFVTRKFVKECYRVSRLFPAEEKFNLTQQVRRAALSVQLNLAEGSSRKSLTERNRFYEIARGSLVEVDSAFDAAIDLEYVEGINIKDAGELLVRLYQMLTRMIFK